MLRGNKNIFHGKDVFAKSARVFSPVPGQNEDAGAAEISGKLDIMRMVSDRKRAGKANAMIHSGFPGEKGLWLNATAIVLPVVGTEIQISDRYSFCR